MLGGIQQRLRIELEEARVVLEEATGKGPARQQVEALVFEGFDLARIQLQRVGDVADRQTTHLTGGTQLRADRQRGMRGGVEMLGSGICVHSNCPLL